LILNLKSNPEDDPSGETFVKTCIIYFLFVGIAHQNI